MDKAFEFIKKNTGSTCKLSLLSGDGSDRRFYRVSGKNTNFILMDGHEPKKGSLINENESYLKIGKHLLKCGLPVPRFFVWDDSARFILMEDLGDTSFFNTFHSSNKIQQDVMKKALLILIELQQKATVGFRTSWCYETGYYDEYVRMEREARYFYDSFVKGFVNIQYKWENICDSFKYISQKAGQEKNSYFMHRDFQSKNIMVKDASLYIIDFQAARLGPSEYDVASLLYDPYIDIPDILKNELLDFYLSQYESRLNGDIDTFKKYYPWIALQRIFQMLGAFAYLGIIRNKKNFLEYIPAALQNFETIIKKVQGPKEIKLLFDMLYMIKKHMGISIANS